MKIEKYLLSAFTDGVYPSLVESGQEGSQYPSAPSSRGEGLVSDGTYLYHVDRNQDDNAVRRIKISTLGSELAALPTNGDDNTSADPYTPDNFHQGTFNSRGTFATYVPMAPSLSTPTSAGQVIW